MDQYAPWAVVILVVLACGAFASRRRRGAGHGTAPYVEDLTERARRGELDRAVGREAEIERVLHVLMRRTKNNPLLLGAPGVGKTAIVEGLAQQVASGNVPKALAGCRVLSLDLNALLAGTKYRGEMEARVRDLLDGLSGDRRTILFVDEFHALAQAGTAEGSVNLAETFKPALARGDLRLIGATTWDEYDAHVRPNAALDRRLQPVLVDEPTPEQAVRMLRALRPAYEAYHRVSIPDDAIEAAVRLSHERIRGRALPDKAVDLIDEAAAKVAIDCSRSHHGTAIGVMHEAARHAEDRVTPEDIEEVVAQWVGREN